MRMHCVSSHSKDSLSVVVLCYMLMCVGCFGLVVSVSTCRLAIERPSDDFFFGLFMLLCVPPALHNI